MDHDEGVRGSGTTGSTEQYARLANAVADGLFQVDADDRLVAVNDALLDAIGRSREELIGASLDRTFLSADAERLSVARRGLIESEPDTVTLPATLSTAGGENRQCEIRLQLVDGTDDGAAGSVRLSGESTESTSDPTETFENALGRAQEVDAETEKFRSLIDAVEEYAIFMLDPAGRITSWNQGAERIKGYDAEEVLGKHISIFYTDEDQAEGVPETNLARAAEVGRCEDEGWRVRADGSRFWANVVITPLRDDDGRLSGYAKVTRDMTERREAEEAIRRERDLTERILETSPIGITVLTAEDEVVHVNERGQEILGIDTATPDIASDDYGQLLDEEGRPIPNEERPSVRAFSTGEQVTDWQCQYEYPDGRLRWLSINSTPVYDEDGEVERVIIVGDDITQLKEQARQLERQRDDLASELDEMFRRIDDAFYAVDDQFRFTYINERAEELLQHEEGQLLGRSVWEVFPDAAETAAWERFHEARDSQKPTSYEVYFDPLDFWVEANVYPSETGLSVYFRDVTERKKRERALEESRNRYQALVENFPSGAVALVDEDLRYTTVGGTPITESNATVAQLEGSKLDEILPPDLADVLVPRYVDALDGERSAFEQEIGDRIYQFWTLPVHNDSGDVFAALGMSQDITEQRERERELQTRVSQQETVTDLGRQALSERDVDELFTEATERVAETLDADYCKVLELLSGGEEVLLRSGVGWRDGLVGDATVDTGRNSQAGYTLRSEEPVVVDDLATESRFSGPELLTSHDVTSGISVVIGTADAPWGVLGVHATDERAFTERDISFVQSVATILATAIERADREHELERYETIVETVDDGVYALDPGGKFVLVNDAFCEMTGYDRKELVGRPGKTVHDDETDETAARLAAEVDAGDRTAAVLEIDLRTADGGTVPVETRFGPYPYGEDRFGRTGIVRDVTERLERERALKRQREELAALNRLNQVVGEITHALVESSSREEIERLVCERLADSESYLFAWVGEVDRASQSVALRTEAGVTGYLDNVTLTIDPSDGDDGPTARAIRTCEPQVVRDIETESIYEPWREVAREYGFRSSAAIPITYEDVLYGVLNVYSRRPGAFDGYERTLLTRLGNVVGHAINALERKEALMSDQIQEIDLELPGIDALVEASIPTEGTVSFERTVSIGGGSYLQYGTADGETMALLEELVETLPFWEELTILDERFGPINFELRLSEPPAISTVATYGGRVESATIENGTYQMRVELPPAADVRVVVEALQEEYPDLELVAQRRTVRDARSVRQVDDVLKERLTDRQRAAMEAAYYAGYFDTPRKRSGEAVAESLAITAPTLHQHLRKGQRKLLSTVFGSPEEE